MRNPYQEIGGMRRKPLWERRHEGPAAVSTSLPFAFLEVPAPKKNEEKENFVATFAWGGGVPTGKRLVPCWHFGAT